MKKSIYQFDNQKQCSAALRIPLAVLKSAKAAGCPAFKLGGRVDAPELLGWLFDRGEQDGTHWREVYDEYRAKRERIRHDKDAEQVVDRSDVQQLCQTALAILFGELDKTFCSELPAALQGRTAPEIRAEAVKAIEAMKERLKVQFTQAAESSE